MIVQRCLLLQYSLIALGTGTEIGLKVGQNVQSCKCVHVEFNLLTLSCLYGSNGHGKIGKTLQRYLGITGILYPFITFIRAFLIQMHMIPN